MNSTSTPSLISTITALTFADSLAPRISSSAHSTIRITAGRLITPPCSGALRERVGDREAEQVVEQLVEVLRPADRDRGRRDAVLEQQARGDDHRDALAQRRVGVGVRRAGHRHGARQLGVADGRQAGDDAGDHERQITAGPADRHRLREDDEDAGADRGADAEQRELEQPDRCARARRPRCRPRSPPSSTLTGLRRRTCSRSDAIAPLPTLTRRRGRAGPPRSRGAPPAAPRRRPRTPPGCRRVPL